MALAEIALEELASALSLAVEPVAGPGRVLHRFGERKTLVDATSKFLVRDDAGNAEFVVLCSGAGGPGMVARGVQRAREVAAALGQDLGRPVLLPLGEGDVHGRTFAVFPYCTPLIESGARWWIQRSFLRPRLVRWLVDASRQTTVPVPDAEHEHRVLLPLHQLRADEGHSQELRMLAGEALSAARALKWQPKHVFMHDDLWLGNVLIDQRSAGGPVFGRFTIIDWAGSRVRGYPLYDFLRLSISFGLTGSLFFRALHKYCAALDYTRSEAGYAFVHTAADLGQRLEHWPRASYFSTINRCFRRLTTGR
jgi:aminoglycoside phosphotransferase (APT) family kinase protein